MKKFIVPQIEVFAVETKGSLLAVSSIGISSTEYDGSADVEKSGRGRAWRDYEGR